MENDGPQSLPANSDGENNERMRLMEQGMADLLQWLRTLMAQGLAAQADTRETWEHLAARLVDSKLGGIARKLRLMAAKIGQPDWPEHLLEEIADLFLICKAFERRLRLDAPTREDLMSVLGVNRRKEDILLEGAKKSDTWLVAGQSFGQEEKLSRRRTWLLGLNSGDFALVLDFAWGNLDFQEQWPLGTCWNAEVVYYPSAYPQRVVVNARQPLQTTEGLASHAVGFADLLQQWAKALSVVPWLAVIPALLHQVTPRHMDSSTILYDTATDKIIPIQVADKAAWQLLAISAGHPIDVFGEWDGFFFTPVTAFTNGELIPLAV